MMQAHSLLVNSASQLDRQLDGIEDSLKKAIIQSESGSQNPDSHLCQSLQMSRFDNRIQLGSSDPHSDALACCLTVFPVFAGSYSQSDVVIDNVSLKERNGIKLSPDQPLQALPPALYYARFNVLPERINAKTDDAGISLILVLPELNGSTPHLTQNQRQSLQRFTELFHKAGQITIVSMGMRKKRSQRAASVLAELSHSKIFGPIRSRLQVQALANDEVPLLFTLINACDHALVPDIGLSIDSLNAGCGCTVWIENNDVPACLKEDPASTDTDTAACRDRKAQAKRQRSMLVQWRMQQLCGKLVTSSINELIGAVEASTVRQGAVSITPHLSDYSSEGYISQQNIVQEEFRTAKPVITRLRESMSRAYRKFNKFRQSPRQFMSDSRYSYLRRLAGSPYHRHT